MKESSLSTHWRAFAGLSVFLFAALFAAADPTPGSPELPLLYEGPGLVDPGAPDGRLPVCPGVQNIQISRANRKPSPFFRTDQGDQPGYTYQHHIDLACWKGRFYAVWDMTVKNEDRPPCHIAYSTSTDGFSWSEPHDLFPFNTAWNLRFYFYRASNDRMLAFGCGPTGKKTIGEADKRTLLVREITADHRLGEIYTLIKPGPNFPPFFEESKDAGFVVACREAANNRPLLEQQDYGVFLGDRRMKWHDAKNWPDGKMGGIAGSSLWIFGKALCFFHRQDGALVGLCKLGFVTLSKDEGETWSFPVIPPGLVVGTGKVWAQKTPDNRYAMIYPPQCPGPRFPMVVTTSDDGIVFRDMRVVHGEVPPRRYAGLYKDLGPQYLRGVAEWAGDAPTLPPLDKSPIWVIYSVNKEDIWVSRIPVPIVPETKEPVHDAFDNAPAGCRVPGWNTYSPTWTRVGIAGVGKYPRDGNPYLELEDREPTDYARAIRTFPAGAAANVSFRLAAAQTDRGRLEIELLGERGSRPVRVILDDRGQIQAVDGRRKGKPSTAEKTFEPGLAGACFGSGDFQRRQGELDILSTIDEDWGKDRGEEWSARWAGYIEGPCSGEVTFTAKASDGLRLRIGDQVIIDGLTKDGARSGKIVMKKGEKTPVVLEFTSKSGKAALRLFWEWQGRETTLVPPAALSYDLAGLPKDALPWEENPEAKAVDVIPYKADAWMAFKINADCAAGKYSLTVDGREVLKNAEFAEPSPTVYALSLRTGKFRGVVSATNRDLPDTEEPSAAAIYRVDDVTTGNPSRGAKQEP